MFVGDWFILASWFGTLICLSFFSLESLFFFLKFSSGTSWKWKIVEEIEEDRMSNVSRRSKEWKVSNKSVFQAGVCL